VKHNIQFEIPNHKNLPSRIERVLEVIYLIFNEGFHSNAKQYLIREELCAEAIRLCRLLLKNASLRTPDVYALFALLCFHAARLESKLNDQGGIVNLKNQDRTTWHWPSIHLGQSAMIKAVESPIYSPYHFEAAIAAEHLKAPSFAQTNWETILHWYEELHQIQPTAFNLLNQAIVLLQMNNYDRCLDIMQNLNPKDLQQRMYLYYSAYSDLAIKINDEEKASRCLAQALTLVSNEIERKYLLKKQAALFSK
jgi:RNA polymerase sigma-70 factor (ECF subfamily)